MARRRTPKGAASSSSGLVLTLGAIVVLLFACIGSQGSRSATRSISSPPAAVAQAPSKTATPRPRATIAPTRQPDPTATPPAPPVGEAAVVANLRSEPRIADETVVGKLCPGDVLDYLTTQHVGDTQWFFVRVASTAGDCDGGRVAIGAEGWAAASVVSEPSYNVQLYAARMRNRLPTPIAASPTPRPTRAPAQLAPAAPSRGRIGALCRDGSRSSATGRGACSRHGGVAQWLYGP